MLIVFFSCEVVTEVSAKTFTQLNLEEVFIDRQVRLLADAAGNGKINVISTLVHNGVDPNSRGINNLTPLFWALREQNKKGFVRLLEVGAVSNIVFDDGRTLIHWATLVKDSFYLAKILEYGGDPNVIDERMRRTPIFEAVAPSGKHNLDLLIKAGANINHQDKSGYTVLIRAAILNQYDVVYKLLQAGANYQLESNNGISLANVVAKSHISRMSFDYKWYKKVTLILEKNRKQKGIQKGGGVSFHQFE